MTGCWDDPDNPACNYVGRGVFYGASVSDSSECKGEDVYIVGGANSAGQAAMFMSRTAKSVTLLVRGPSLATSMSYYLIQQIEKNDNITVRTCTEVVDTLGEDDHLTGLVLLDRQSGEKETVTCRPAVLLHRRRAAHRMAGRDCQGRPRIHPVRPGPQGGQWLDAGTSAASLGNKCARCVCCRGCACRVSQTGGRRRRRRVDGGDVGAPVFGRGLGADDGRFKHVSA